MEAVEIAAHAARRGSCAPTPAWARRASCRSSSIARASARLRDAHRGRARLRRRAGPRRHARAVCEPRRHVARGDRCRAPRRPGSRVARARRRRRAVRRRPPRGGAARRRRCTRRWTTRRAPKGASARLSSAVSRAAARARRSCWSCEDVHWATPWVLACLRALADRRRARCRCSLVCTTRREGDPFGVRAARHRDRALRPGAARDARRARARALVPYREPERGSGMRRARAGQSAVPHAAPAQRRRRLGDPRHHPERGAEPPRPPVARRQGRGAGRVSGRASASISRCCGISSTIPTTMRARSSAATSCAPTTPTRAASASCTRSFATAPTRRSCTATAARCIFAPRPGTSIATRRCTRSTSIARTTRARLRRLPRGRAQRSGCAALRHRAAPRAPRQRASGGARHTLRPCALRGRSRARHRRRRRRRVAAFERALAHASDDAQRCNAYLGIASAHRATGAYAEAGLAALARVDAARDRAPSCCANRRAPRTCAAASSSRAATRARRTPRRTRALEHARAAGDGECEAQALSGLADVLYAEGRMTSCVRRVRAMRHAVRPPRPRAVRTQQSLHACRRARLPRAGRRRAARARPRARRRAPAASPRGRGDGGRVRRLGTRGAGELRARHRADGAQPRAGARRSARAGG